MLTLNSIRLDLYPRLLNPKPLFVLLFSSQSAPVASASVLVDSMVKQSSLSSRFSDPKRIGRARSVVQYLRDIGFSDAQIRYAVGVQPQILLSRVEKTLEPKAKFFQDIGFRGPVLAHFLSRNSSLFTVSLERKMVPCVEVLKKLLFEDKNHEGLVRVVKSCGWIIARDPSSFLLPNIAFLESCGIVDSQLVFLLKRQPRLFISAKSKVRNLVSRALNMGFKIKSRMLVYAVYVLSCMSAKTFEGKLQLFRSYGFSDDELMEMINRAPIMLGFGEDKLKSSLDFFIDNLGFSRAMLVRRPSCLMYSLENRVIPRYKVMEVLRIRGLLKKNQSLLEMVSVSEEDFYQRFISKYEGHELEALLLAYKGHMLKSSASSEAEGEVEESKLLELQIEPC